MKERPMIFSGESVRAILAGHKTQTRRTALGQRKPGEIGDRLWVRETWAETDSEGGDVVVYAAGGHGLIAAEGARAAGTWREYLILEADVGAITTQERWRSPRYMPRWVSRLTLEITAVRVERLQEISYEDAVAEGITPLPDSDIGDELSVFVGFRTEWDAINGKRAPWSSNPWVWAITFQRLA